MDMLFNDSINPVCSVTDYNDFLDFMSVVSFKQCGNMSYEIVYRSDDGYLSLKSCAVPRSCCFPSKEASNNKMTQLDPLN